ncbi:hypothetical protein AXG93_3857s1020 [Marchantia polymorpha subsp. ruderalis]|uniref:Uncharacterized protein n=1 Tax=Marchantia polymorpha subsp. ruderalis TaxID=1480154 RepID=A0A176W384_MARPO|nr:hypothetical protein AXG93_3857s1020 [Marchantia polymorpha subsp. ruderalis]
MAEARPAVKSKCSSSSSRRAEAAELSRGGEARSVQYHYCCRSAAAAAAAAGGITTATVRGSSTLGMCWTSDSLTHSLLLLGQIPSTTPLLWCEQSWTGKKTNEGMNNIHYTVHPDGGREGRKALTQFTLTHSLTHSLTPQRGHSSDSRSSAQLRSVQFSSAHQLISSAQLARVIAIHV